MDWQQILNHCDAEVAFFESVGHETKAQILRRAKKGLHAMDLYFRLRDTNPDVAEPKKIFPYI